MNYSPRQIETIKMGLKEEHGVFASPILNKIIRSPERQKDSAKNSSPGSAWMKANPNFEVDRKYLAEVARLRMDAANLKANLSNEIFRLKKNATG